MTQNMSVLEELKPAIRERGMTPELVEQQLERFQTGFPDLVIDRAATLGDGILQLQKSDAPHLLKRFQQAQDKGCVIKFVPASGAASRMFSALESMINSDGKRGSDYLEKHPDDPEVRYTRYFLDHLETFAFYEDLKEILDSRGLSKDEMLKNGDWRELLSLVMREEGLGLVRLPKALIPFHRYSDHCRTPLEEHLVEAVAYTRSKKGRVRIHFTISPEHEQAFVRRLSAVRDRYETGSIRLTVETSFQRPETDTIAVNPDNEPFIDDEGKPVFRPGGHGALLVNLEELWGDLIFIKNIDNVVPDNQKETTIYYKKLIGGYLLTVQDRIFSWLKELDRGNIDPVFLEEITDFLKNELCITPPSKSGNALARYLFDRLNRPLRVCGMVRNEGEPGGGPFIVLHPDGTTSLQIVESAQVNMNDPEQKKSFEKSSHFNPVDLVCSMRDYQGRSFSLESFRDPDTGFISQKTHQGRALKALELPGLWNGSMAGWNTLFVEVPSETFKPVKTVNDLLRPEHRNTPE